MKSYSRKQAGVIFANWKRGNITADEHTISELYAYADSYATNWQSWELDMVRAVRAAVDAIFADDMAEAQKQLDRFIYIDGLHTHAA